MAGDPDQPDRGSAERQGALALPDPTQVGRAIERLRATSCEFAAATLSAIRYAPTRLRTRAKSLVRRTLRQSRIFSSHSTCVSSRPEAAIP